MNIATHAQSLYGQSRSLKTPRDLEYEVFARLTGRLKTARTPGRGQLTPDLIAALHDNRRLWTTLAMDLAHPDNAFPQDLRARLFYLAEYTMLTTDRLLGGQVEPGDGTDSLIEINTAIMRGLRGEVPR
jgi:flagellar biosynthesis activator protein FlaF